MRIKELGDSLFAMFGSMSKEELLINYVTKLCPKGLLVMEIIFCPLIQ